MYVLIIHINKSWAWLTIAIHKRREHFWSLTKYKACNLSLSKTVNLFEAGWGRVLEGVEFDGINGVRVLINRSGRQTWWSSCNATRFREVVLPRGAMEDWRMGKKNTWWMFWLVENGNGMDLSYGYNFLSPNKILGPASIIFGSVCFSQFLFVHV